ncbi:MAG: JAB domain-containing protein [Syntrophobacteraceae bacterium]
MFELISLQEKAFRPDEVVLDPETGLLMYEGKFNYDTGTIIEPQLLFNSNPSAPAENHLETSRKKPPDAIGRTQSSAQGAPFYLGWRNPKYQSLRYVYVRNNIIVDHEGVSCGTPGATGICLGDPDQYILYMRSHIERLGADTVYMIHNHTSGDPTPSIADLAATAYVFGKIPQLIGHIIINSAKYAFIVPDGTAHTVSPLPNLPADWVDPILHPSVSHHLLGRTAKGTNQIAAWTKALTSDHEAPILIYLDKRLRVRGLQRVNPNRLFDRILIADAMPQKLIEFGVNGAVAALPSGLSNDMLGVARELVRSHILWAAVGIRKDGTPFGFAAEIPNPDYLGGKHRNTFEPYYIK